MKRLAFLGRSHADLISFPEAARRKAGYQLSLVQAGLEPEDWKPMPGIGTGVKEIRVRDASGAYRIIYVATFEDAVYVLHAFQKKSRKTPMLDMELASVRLRQLEREVRS